MATGDRIDPYKSFRFRVEINGIQTASFSEASVPNSTTQSTNYREGTDLPWNRKLSAGPVEFSNLTLKKGITDSMELYAWRKIVEESGSGPARRNISIVLIDEQGNDAATWNVFEAWPSGLETSGLNAMGNDIMVETLELTLESIQRVK